MVLSERIQKYVQRLPSSFQVEVLHFVEYLAAQAEEETIAEEREVWSTFSLSFAMRDIEDEEQPVYTTSDLRVTFS